MTMGLGSEATGRVCVGEVSVGRQSTKSSDGCPGLLSNRALLHELGRGQHGFIFLKCPANL